MCGIAGSICFQEDQKVNLDVLRRMSDKLKKRGPDDKGEQLLCDGRVGLVHRRLAIVDLSKEAAQPMSDNYGELTVVYNGEIYNHQEIREELNQNSKIEWKTAHSDTETILYAYRQWGISCIEKFIGMFAFALWDGKNNKLYLVRDRLGIKPLYYGILEGKLNFASSVRALLEDNEQSLEVDKKAVFDYLSLLAVPAPNTLFEHIKKCRPGHYIEVTLDGNINVHCYWDVSSFVNRDKIVGTEKKLSEELLLKLKDATFIRKMADVPIGIFLSGGVDSSTNLALFSEGETDVKTFTSGYIDINGYENENRYAREVANHFGANHHDLFLCEKDIIGFIEQLKELSDDPIADPVLVTQYYIAKLARENDVKVVQVGEGADELFAGYIPWERLAIYEELNNRLPLRLKVLCHKVVNKLKIDVSEETRELIRRGAEGEAVFWGANYVYIAEERKKEIFSEKFLEAVGNHKTWDNFCEVYQKNYKSVGKDTYAWMSAINMNFRLPELLLARSDRACMEAGVEARVPFLDHRLVEWGICIPGNYKCKDGIGKHILKKAATELVPQNVLDRKKSGFGLPYTEWYNSKLGQIMKKYIYRFISDSGYFNKGAARRALDLNVSSANYPWAMFVLSLWWDRYISSADGGL